MRSRNLDLRARVFGVVALLIAACCGSPPALAKATANTVAKLTNIYTPTIMDAESNYVRVIIKDLDRTTVKSATIGIKRKKVVSTYTVDVADIASAVLKVGMTEAKPGRIDFRLPVDLTNPKLPVVNQTFKPGDEVTLTINYNKDFSNLLPLGKHQPKSVVFRSGLTSTGANQDESKPVPVNGFTYALDPVYTAFNDLDTTLYGSVGARFEIRNLQFFSNVDEAFVTGFDTGALLGASFNPTLPNFTLDSSELSGLEPSFQEMLDAFEEPGPGKWVMSVGQIYSLEDGMVVATFLNAAQAAPEPAGIGLFLVGVLAMGWARRGSWRRMARICLAVHEGRSPAH